MISKISLANFSTLYRTKVINGNLIIKSSQMGQITGLGEVRITVRSEISSTSVSNLISSFLIETFVDEISEGTVVRTLPYIDII